MVCMDRMQGSHIREKYRCLLIGCFFLLPLFYWQPFDAIFLEYVEKVNEYRRLVAINIIDDFVASSRSSVSRLRTIMTRGTPTYSKLYKADRQAPNTYAPWLKLADSQV